MVHDSRVCRGGGPTKPSGKGITGPRRPTFMKMLAMPQQVDPRRSEPDRRGKAGKAGSYKARDTEAPRATCLKVESVSIRVKPTSTRRKSCVTLMSLTAKRKHATETAFFHACLRQRGFRLFKVRPKKLNLDTAVHLTASNPFHLPQHTRRSVRVAPRQAYLVCPTAVTAPTK